MGRWNNSMDRERGYRQAGHYDDDPRAVLVTHNDGCSVSVRQLIGGDIDLDDYEDADDVLTA